MTKENSSFEERHAFLRRLAREKGGSAMDAAAWRGDYDAGLTPEESWAREWGDET